MINNKILALKYRPQEFDDLIGQEVMAQTITNSIKLKKTPNAYLLTGIRGVGKTTTARLIAKALNCIKNIDETKKCNSESFCESCKDIVESNHIDILEMDAASKTGIDDIRELIENSKYSPSSAQYKIFIIDEVHMLSKQAFNGLLKTLEEPPPRLKFILATTEVRKIPVTILSRCQRFDLKRVNLQVLLAHLKKISDKEEGKISENALKLVARASEGSVRDAISLLDRALITQNLNKNKIIEDVDIRKMLGLADKSKIIFLFKEILKGNQKEATAYLKELIDSGLDARNFLNDILEILYLFSRRINLGPIEKDMMISEFEVELIDQYTKDLDMYDLGLFWQLTIKTLNDIKIVNDENLTLEMYIMQLSHLKSIEKSQDIKINLDSTDQESLNQKVSTDQEESSNFLKKKMSPSIKNQLKSTEQIRSNVKEPELKEKKISKGSINTFLDLINFANKENEVELRYDLERNVKLVSFSKGKISISFNEKLNKNFIKNLTEKLLYWTGDRWIISLSKNEGERTLHEARAQEKQDKLTKEENSVITKELLSAFPDAQLTDVKEESDND
ncbi:DNA polymerase III subunit gamma/tau [Pelagibacteraceae bacterium]|nr:DNA polymerase III subunit gamma/tau [Pelagibacteraceae bacterium]